MEMSDDINELATALAKAQGQMDSALKDASNPFFKSKYADLTSVWEACRKPLASNGLSVVQSPAVQEARVTLTTLLLHTSGQWIKTHIACVVKDESPQSIGSATTYLRRYALQSLVGVTTDDDDGEAAQGRAKTNGHASQAVPAPKAPEGYHAWLLDLEATADNGMEALQKAWGSSLDVYRRHLNATDPTKSAQLKAKAQKVKGQPV